MPARGAALVRPALRPGRTAGGDQRLEIGLPVAPIAALVVTRVHTDPVGRLPSLLAAGYRGPMLCSLASAALVALVPEDAL